MRIGELARCSGTSVQTLRYYEREGILRRPPRTESGYRVYSPADIEHILFVKRCQALGFSLSDIQRISALHDMGPGAGCGARPSPSNARKQFLALARKRLAVLDAKIAEMRGLRRQVAQLLAQAERAPSAVCPANAVKKKPLTL